MVPAKQLVLQALNLSHYVLQLVLQRCLSPPQLLAVLLQLAQDIAHAGYSSSGRRPAASTWQRPIVSGSGVAERASATIVRTPTAFHDCLKILNVPPSCQGLRLRQFRFTDSYLESLSELRTAFQEGCGAMDVLLVAIVKQVVLLLGFQMPLTGPKF